MASPRAKGLFHKAIGQSGSFWEGKPGSLESFEEAHNRGISFAKRMGAPSVVALRAMPAETLNSAASWTFQTNPIVTAFSPNVDRYIVTDLPAARFFRKQQMKIPLLAGWNANEGLPFDALGLPHKDAAQFTSAAEQMFGKDRASDFARLYPARSDAEANKSAAMLTGDITIAEQVWQWLELQRRASRAPVYGYKFTYTSDYTPVAGHVTDVPFVFGTLTPQFVIGKRTPGGPADRTFADMVMSYWVNFATRGDPNGPGLPHWPAYDSSGTVLGLGNPIAAVANPDVERFRFISSYRRGGVFPTRWRTNP